MVYGKGFGLVLTIIMNIYCIILTVGHCEGTNNSESYENKNKSFKFFLSLNPSSCDYKENTFTKKRKITRKD